MIYCLKSLSMIRKFPQGSTIPLKIQKNIQLMNLMRSFKDQKRSKLKLDLDRFTVPIHLN